MQPARSRRGSALQTILQPFQRYPRFENLHVSHPIATCIRQYICDILLPECRRSRPEPRTKPGRGKRSEPLGRVMPDLKRPRNGWRENERSKKKGRENEGEDERSGWKRDRQTEQVCSTLAFLSPGPLTQPQLPVAVSAIDKRDFHQTEIKK